MEFKKGNAKLGKDTLIFNFGDAINCPSAKKGLCRVADKCYARKAEIQYYKTVPAYRLRQKEAWDNQPLNQIVKEIKGIVKRARTNKIKFVRFSEAGDFKDQDSVYKLFALAHRLPELTIYGYTARSDLCFLGRPKNLIINGSGFMIDNSFTAVDKSEIKDSDLVCSTKCVECDLCKEKGGHDIKVVMH